MPAMKKVHKATETSAWGINQTYNWLKKGRTRKWAAEKQGISKDASSRYIQILRESFKGKPPSFIPPRNLTNWSFAKGKKAIRTIEFAKSAIKGEARVKSRLRKGRPQSKHTGKVIAALKKNPLKNSAEIARDCGVSPQTVNKWRVLLVDKGQIQRISLVDIRKRQLRDPKRRTDTFRSAGKREQILKGNWPKIEKAAKRVYNKAKNVFDAANMGPGEIADEIKERVDWKLQTYNPSKLMGAEETKLARYLNYHIGHLAFDLKRTALRQYKPIQSLESGAQDKSGKVWTYRQTLKAKTIPIELTLKTLEKISTELKLNIVEEAVLYGLAAGMQANQIAKGTGYTESNIGLIKKKLLKRVKALQKKGTL